MAVNLDMRSEGKLIGVHPDLVRVVKEAANISDVDFIITEGLRSVERQKQLVAAGASQTMKSRHLDGHAIDVAIKVSGEVRWDWPLYEKFSHVMKQAAANVKVPIEWGGDWTSLKDGPHYQLPWETYK
jgi:peptidoglycan L-alanyl-D-glutamate endopeptidase CwlK